MGGLVGRVDDASQVYRRMLVYEGIVAAQDFREWLCKDQWIDIVYSIY